MVYVRHDSETYDEVRLFLNTIAEELVIILELPIKDVAKKNLQSIILNYKCMIGYDEDYKEWLLTLLNTTV